MTSLTKENNKISPRAVSAFQLVFFATFLVIALLALMQESAWSQHPDLIHAKQENQINGYLARKEAKQQKLSNQDISNAYIYLLGRMLLLKQEQIDQQVGFKWNIVAHREPGEITQNTPDPNIAYSGAWIILDKTAPVILEIPPIKDRYYTWQMLNGWGETVVNINERAYPHKPFGKYALCLAGSNPPIPKDALRIDLPSQVVRAVGRIELGNDPQEAIRLQNQITLTASTPSPYPTPINIPPFTINNLPGADIFNNASEILASETDINPGMQSIRQKVGSTEALVKSNQADQMRVNEIIRKHVIPQINEAIQSSNTTKNGWARQSKVGNYGIDYVSRTVNHLIDIDANDSAECVYFYTDNDNTGTPLNGSTIYTMTFTKDELPQRYASFWSIVVTNVITSKQFPNAINRHSFHKNSSLHYNSDGSLTLVFAPAMPNNYPQSNWLPTPPQQNYKLTFNFYVPIRDLIDGNYTPPPILKNK